MYWTANEIILAMHLFQLNEGIIDLFFLIHFLHEVKAPTGEQFGVSVVSSPWDSCTTTITAAAAAQLSSYSSGKCTRCIFG